MTPTPGGFDRVPRRADTVLVLVQTVFYIVGILAMFGLAALFYGHMVERLKP